MERLQCIGHHHGRNCIRLSPALQGKCALPHSPRSASSPVLPSVEALSPGARWQSDAVYRGTHSWRVQVQVLPPPGWVHLAGSVPASPTGWHLSSKSLLCGLSRVESLGQSLAHTKQPESCKTEQHGVRVWTVGPSCLCCIPALSLSRCVTTGPVVSSAKWGR